MFTLFGFVFDCCAISLFFIDCRRRRCCFQCFLIVAVNVLFIFCVVIDACCVFIVVVCFMFLHVFAFCVLCGLCGPFYVLGLMTMFLINFLYVFAMSMFIMICCYYHHCYHHRNTITSMIIIMDTVIVITISRSSTITFALIIIIVIILFLTRFLHTFLQPP